MSPTTVSASADADTVPHRPAKAALGEHAPTKPRSQSPNLAVEPADFGETFVVGADRVRLLRDGIAAHAAMLAAIEGAKQEVLLEIYWIGADLVGRRFRDALVERATAGISVRVIYDAVGSFGVTRGFWAPLIQAGGQVREFSPIAPWRHRFRLARIHLRDHRKNLVVDHEIGFAGGINLGDAWAPAEGSGWRDDAIEIRGSAARTIREVFFQVWTDLGGASPAGLVVAAPTGARVHVLTNEIAGGPDRALRRAYLWGIRHAHTSIMITSAYFLPGATFLFALRRAARRGVRVRVLLPGRSDVWVVSLAMQSIIGRLLQDGVGVFAYSGRILHSKTAVFDERFAMVGSHNLDVLSWKYNLECNVVVDDDAFARHVARSFEADCSQAQQLSLAAWRSRPWALRSAAWFFALFRNFL